MHTFNRLFSYISCIVIVGTLTACGGGSAAIRYYLVDPVNYLDSPVAGNNDLVVEIMDVHIPQYMERFNIVSRENENQLYFSEHNQWGDNFRKNLLRTMASNLSSLLGTDDIGTPVNRTLSVPDFRIQIHIEQFERNYDGHVRLVARWQVLDTGDRDGISTHFTELQSNGTYNMNEYENIVASMKDIFGQFSRLIAESVSQRQ